MLYIANRGDSILKIASKYNCRVPDVCALNNLTDRSLINEGQTLLLKPINSGPKKNTYVVRY